MVKIKFTAKEVAEILKGIVQGDEMVELSNFGKIESADKGDLTFLANPKYEEFLYTTKASAVLVNKEFEPKEEYKTTLIRVDDPYSALAELLQLVAKQLDPKRKGVDKRAIISDTAEVGADCYIAANAFIDDNAKIGKGVQIYPNVYVGRNVVVEDNVILYPNVSLYYGVHIGKNCIIHSGAVIGSDGFGFAPTLEGYSKIPQIGNVILEENVEIGANTCIDRAAMGSTVIRRGTKLDNLVQIAHNCEVGVHNVFAGQAALAGSTKTGAWCQFGGQVGVAGHLKIGDRVQISAQSGIMNDIPNDKTMFGSPATEAREAMRGIVMGRKLPSLFDSVKRLEKELKNIQNDKN